MISAQELRGPPWDYSRTLGIEKLCGENFSEKRNLIVVGVRHNGLGNTLFQYAGSRLVAWALNADFASALIVSREGALNDKIPPHSLDAWHSFPEIFSVTEREASCAELTPRFGEYKANGTLLFADRPADRKRRKPRETLFDLLTALSKGDLACLKLISYFQDYALFRGLIPLVRTWLPVRTDQRLSHLPTSEDVVIHVRLCKTPYHSYRYYDLDYFAAILAKVRPGPGGRYRVLSPCDPRVPGVVNDLFRKFNAVPTSPLLLNHAQPRSPSATAAADFLYLAHARRLIICESTFSWWAALLSNATEIHAPGTGVVPVAWDDPRFVFHDIGHRRFFGRLDPSASGIHYNLTL